jgi:hypothetical protein
MDEMAAEIRQLREQLRHQEEKRKWKVVHRSSLQARTAPPIPRTTGVPGETSFMEDELSPEGKMLSLKWRNLSSANSSKYESQMAPLSFLENRDKEACGSWEGRGIH